MSAILYFDVETIPAGEYPTTEWMVENHPGNMSVQKTINAWAENPENKELVFRKRSTSILLSQAIVISAAYGDEKPTTFKDYKEKDLLVKFDNWLSSLRDNPKSTKDLIKQSPDTWTLVGYNIKEFDIPILFLRAKKYKCHTISKLLSGLSRYDRRIEDVMTMALPTMGKQYVKMEELCKFFGIEGKGDIDGSNVYDYYLQGKLGEIAEYCKKDVERTRELYKILT